MKKFKNILLLVLAFVLFGGVTNVNAEGKVKVYTFEAGGCPYCEAELEYLKGLSSYGEKFEIIQKELYVDHVDWKWGKDYPLGKAVAEAFQSIGNTEASYTGTPFVIISDVYAGTGYNTNLEEAINLAYEQGDKDVVGCYANDGTNCLEGADPSIKVDWSLVPGAEDESKDDEKVATIVLLLIIAGTVALVIYTGKKNSEVKEEIVKVEEKKPVVKEEKAEPKKVTKTSAKKSPKKKKK